MRATPSTLNPLNAAYHCALRFISGDGFSNNNNNNLYCGHSGPYKK